MLLYLFLCGLVILLDALYSVYYVHCYVCQKWPMIGWNKIILFYSIRAASSEFGTYRLCEQRRFRRACASAQSRQNLRCSLIQAMSQEEPSDIKPDPWPLWMAGHAQLKFVMTECSKTQIRLKRPILSILFYSIAEKSLWHSKQWIRFKLIRHSYH